MTTLPWYALRVRSRCETLASGALAANGYEPFVPCYRARRRWSDRFKEVELPLFPGYLFCRLDISHRLPVLMAPGVVQIVGTGKTPVAIEDREIEAVRAVTAAGLAAQPCGFVRVGSRVRVEDGPLRGVEGFAAGLNERHQFVVSISLLQRSICVEMNKDWLRPAH